MSKPLCMAMLSLPYLQRAIVKPPVLEASCSAKSRPVVVFDMAFKDPSDLRRPQVVSAAAQSLAGIIRDRRLATPIFMQAPFVQSGQLNFPPGISERRPLVFALSLFDDLFRVTQAEVARIRVLFPRATIVLGGPGVNTAKELRQLKAFFPEANALVKGDGELAFCQLLACLKSGQLDVDKMEALAVKGVYATVAGREYLDNRTNILSVEELNKLPGITAFPDLVKEIKTKGYLELHTSRGCKYRCVFCSHKYHDRPIYWSADRLLQELRKIKDSVKRGELPVEAKNIFFTDDDFFQDKERAAKFLSLIAADPVRNYFTFSFQGAIGSFLSGGNVDWQLLARLRQIKVAWLNFGTDGFSDKMLRLLGKSGYNWQQVKELIVALDILGFTHCHYAILTHPQMDKEMFFEQVGALLAVLSRNPHMRINVNGVLTAYEGAWLMEKAKQYVPDRLDILSGPNEERKYLPIHLPMADDPYLALAIISVLRQPFLSVAQLVKNQKDLSKKGYAWQKVAKLTAQIVRWRRRQPADLTVLEAINSQKGFVVWTALRFLLEETTKELLKNGIQP